MEISLREDRGRVLIAVRAAPRASRTALVGLHGDGALKVAVAAPPVDGAANEALLKFLARTVLRIAPSRLEVFRGTSGRDKVVAVEGLGLEEVRALLVAALP